MDGEPVILHESDRLEPEPVAEMPGALRRAKDEIAEEVRQRRRSGELLPSFERRLEVLFEACRPSGTTALAAENALSRLVDTSYVDIEVPLASRLPGGVVAKRVLRRLMAWYLNYLAQQVNRLAGSALHAVELLHERTSALEAAGPPERTVAPVPVGGAGEAPAEWAEVALAALVGTRAPVLHADCGSGLLLSALAGAGLDAYGVDPRAELADQAAMSHLEVRCESAIEHLRGLADRSLGGLVLSGCVDTEPLVGQRALAELAAAKLEPGGRLVLAGRMPEALSPSSADVDLALGRPLHPETWGYLLAAAGLSVGAAQMGPPAGALVRLPGDDEVSRAANANLAVLEEVLLGPRTFVITATRPTAR